MELELRDRAYGANLILEAFEASHGLSHWIYDAEGNLLKTNSKDLALDTIFDASSCKQEMIRHGIENDLPILLSVPFGFMWIAVFEHREKMLHRIYVLGPAFHTEISMVGIQRGIENFHIPAGWKQGFTALMKKLPILSGNSIRRAAVMLHFSATGEKISPVDVVNLEIPGNIPQNTEAEKRDRHRTYLAEQQLLSMVREGNLNYKDALQQATAVSSGVPINVDTPIHQLRISQVVFTSLCVRAAIEGGLSPDVAYSVGDGYLQRINDAEDISTVGNLGLAMYSEFIQLVYSNKQRGDLSKPIQSCCAYIDLHIEDELSMQQLARRVGYTVSYLSKKFPLEVGMTVSEYIKSARIARACILLTTTEETIPEIGQRLHFCNRGHFSTVFKGETGMTPVEYRKKHQSR